jgi:hypothetical protein
MHKKELRIPAITLKFWWPSGPVIWRKWLPSRGNVLFTLLVIGLFFWAQNAGAISIGAPMAAPTSTAGIPYQGRLADKSGAPLTQTVNMIFRLYSVASGGSPLWEEQWTGSNSVQVSDGLFNVMLGSVTPIPPSVITGNSNLFLGITVGTDSEMSPRVQLGSVPFATQALTVPDGSITSGKLADRSITLSKLAPNILPRVISQKHIGYTQAYAFNSNSHNFTETAAVVTVTTRSAIVINATASLAVESGAGELYTKINRDGAFVASQRYIPSVSPSLNNWGAWAWSGADIVEPGTHTYVLNGESYVGSIVVKWYHPVMTLTIIPIE